jgi:integrase
MVARWLLAVMSGLRWREALGLSWQDINLDRGTARIRQALRYQPGTGLAALVNSRCPSVA